MLKTRWCVVVSLPIKVGCFAMRTLWQLGAVFRAVRRNAPSYTNITEL